MIEANNEKLNNLLKGSLQTWSTRSNELPISKGLVLTPTEIVTREFTDQTTKEIRTYGAYCTLEGFTLPFGQIARKNNGLGLNGTNSEMIKAFNTKVDGKNYKVKVTDVIKIDSNFNSGKQTFYTFSEVNTQAQTDTAEIVAEKPAKNNRRK